MGRDKETQAVLPLRGKVLNTWEVERDRLFANNEIHDIAVAIGVDPHGPNDDARFQRPALRQGVHPERRRRRRLAHPGAAADAVLPPLSQADRARPCLHRRPPLFRIDAPARGKRPAAKIYVRWTRASSTPRWTSCARKARKAKAAGASAASRAWAR
jgi:topoisomerase-4 subunit B